MELKRKIEDKSARVGVIGMGYVGLPLATAFAESGFKVLGIDIDSTCVEGINKGKSHIQGVSDEFLRNLVDQEKISTTTDFAAIKDLDAVLVCVPTPLNKLKDPDVSHILDVTRELANHLHKGLLIILESTTYPGTTRELVLDALAASDLKVGEDYFLCYSPERIDPGNKSYGIKNTPKVVGGVTKQCTELGKSLYEQVVDQVVQVSSPETAEMVKLLENTFRSINIGLANEVAIMCEKLGVDVWEVIDAAATKPFGFMKFTPGPGLGGHCIPVDPHYLSWKMRSLEYRARFIELAGEVNTDMPHHVVELISAGLNRNGHALNGSKILIVGVAYKKDIDDVRESPALDVMSLLEEQGAEVGFFDPFVKEIQWNGESMEGLMELSAEELKSTQAVVILTDHSDLDYDLIKKEGALIIDTRNVYPENHDEHIVRLGVGRK